MAEYINLRKYVKTFSSEEYNDITETGFWRAGVLDGLSVWYLLVPVQEHTIIEPNCKIYKLNFNSTYEEFEPHKLIIDAGYNVYVYVRLDLSDPAGTGRLGGKLLIF